MHLAEKRQRRRLEAVAALLLLLPRPSKPLIITAVRKAIVESSADSYITGAKTGAVDAARAGREIGKRIDPVELEVPYEAMLDRADEAAANYAEAWLRSFAEREEAAQQYGERYAARLATDAQSYRLDRIAASETPAAFNQARVETLRESVRSAGIEEDLIIRVWQTEAGPCPICADNDGEVASLHGPYPNGDEPGQAHPFCRCYESYELRH